MAMTIAKLKWIVPLCAVVFAGQLVDAAEPLKLKKRDRVVVIGKNAAEQMRRTGYLEALIHTRLPELQLRFRHLGGVEHHTILIPNANYQKRSNLLWRQLHHLGPDVIVAILDVPALSGKDTVDEYVRRVSTWIQLFQWRKYNGESPPRVVLVSPTAVEDPGTEKSESAAKRNEKISKIVTQLPQFTGSKGIAFVDLFAPTAKLAPTGGTLRGARLTSDGKKLNDYGCWVTAHLIADMVAPLKGGERIVVDVKAKKIDATRSFGESATFSDTGFHFFRLAEYYPGPVPPADAKLHAEFQGRLQRLIVRGLKEGKYTLRIDGQKIVNGTADQWAAGVAVIASPGQVKTQKLLALIKKKNKLFVEYLKKPTNKLKQQLADADQAIIDRSMSVRTERWLLEPAK